MIKVEKTEELFSGGLNCSQAILTVFGEAYGLDAEKASGLGRILGGGIGHMARTCGAVTAAVLILGLANDGPNEIKARETSFAAGQEFFRRFETLHGTSECKQLLGADISTDEGLKTIREEKLVGKVCPRYVRDAANLLQTMLTA